MNDSQGLYAKASVWEKLRRPWEHHQPDLPAAHPASSGLSAMDVELRAMRARPDPAYGDAVSALNNSGRPGR